ncbi:MAG: nucleotidyltransferase family protein [Candidatus Hydrogenedentes bacterium]|nr:nucleotidyltransferase family protein [Candidatus Hydrogenedentota bacterium]
MTGDHLETTPGPELRDTTAVVLAGGMGLRLRPVVPNRQKVMAEIGGRPFLTYLLDKLEASGLRHVVLCCGYLAEDLIREFGDAYGGMRISISCEPSPLGTAGALRRALPLIESDPVLVLNGDSYCSLDLSPLPRFHRQHASEATLMLVETDDCRAYGRVETNEEGCIQTFVEKEAVARSGWVNAGVYLLNRDLIAEIPSGRAVSIEKEMFPRWTTRALYGFKGNGTVVDIGTPERFAAANRYFASHHHRMNGGISHGY